MSQKTRLERAERALDASPGAADRPADAMRFWFAVATLGEHGPEGLPGELPGGAERWAPFFQSWTLFRASSDTWAGRGLLPPKDYAPEYAPVLRLRVWHLVDRTREQCGPETRQLSAFGIRVVQGHLVALDHEDYELLLGRPSPPPAVLDALRNDPEAMLARECFSCRCEMTPAFATCPHCGSSSVGPRRDRWEFEQAGLDPYAAPAPGPVWPTAAAPAPTGNVPVRQAAATTGPANGHQAPPAAVARQVEDHVPDYDADWPRSTGQRRRRWWE